MAIIEKFGRVMPYEDDEGFKLTPNIDYDIHFKSLTNVADPKLTQDAVNLGTLEMRVRSCLKDAGDSK